MPFNKIHWKILQPAELKTLVKEWQAAGQKVVFTNGCFDILHRGHVDYLSKAAALGDKMVVALNGDKSVKKLKGKNRPIQDEESRMEIMASLFFVDAVVKFNEDTPLKLIQLLQPDILVKGGDYKPSEIVGADVVKSKKGKVIVLPYIEGYSTSGIDEKIRNSKK